jgi:uncharacterized membrane protein YkvA (DUF1232 family)
LKKENLRADPKYPVSRTWFLKQQILLLYYGLTDPRTPFYAKLPALLSILYFISPIDLIPDFIPVFGYLDDLLIVPLLLKLSIGLFPDEVRESGMLRAVKQSKRINLLLYALLTGGLIMVAALCFSLFKFFGWLFTKNPLGIFVTIYSP